jgi:hypothetical protein
VFVDAPWVAVIVMLIAPPVTLILQVRVLVVYLIGRQL